MNRKRRKLLFLFALLLLLVGLPAWWLNREIQHERDNVALIAAIKRNDTAAALQALDSGADPNSRDMGDTKPSIGQRLLQLWDRIRGYKRIKASASQPTAIMLLFGLDERDEFPPPPDTPRLLQALLERGADPNVTNMHGETPLHMVAPGGNPEMVRLLIANGAHVNVKNKNGWTPLHGACIARDLRIAQILLEYGADGNAKDEDGQTPLSLVLDDTRAFHKQHLQLEEKDALIRLLKQHGAK